MLSNLTTYFHRHRRNFFPYPIVYFSYVAYPKRISTQVNYCTRIIVFNVKELCYTETYCIVGWICEKYIKYWLIFPSLTFGSSLNVSQAKGHCNLSQWTHSSWSIGSCSAAHIVLFSALCSRVRCERIIPSLKGEPSFNILKAADPTHSIVLYIII